MLEIKIVRSCAYSPSHGVRTICILCTASLFQLLTSQVSAGDFCRTSPEAKVSRELNIAHNGHDVVSFIDTDTFSKGLREFKAYANNTIYLFSSHKNRETFLKNIETYDQASETPCDASKTKKDVREKPPKIAAPYTKPKSAPVKISKPNNHSVTITSSYRLYR